MVYPLKRKIARGSFPRILTERSSDLLELVHSDAMGPVNVESFRGGKYTLLFVDDFSRKVYCYIFSSKAEVSGKFQEFKAMAENQTARTIRKRRTDNGTEYVNKAFMTFLEKNGIIHQTAVKNTPEENGAGNYEMPGI